jgi:hypothetical protein
MRSVAKRKLKTFHGTLRVTRIEEWFVEAESEAEARALLEQGEGYRSHTGERIQVELEKLSG